MGYLDAPKHVSPALRIHQMPAFQLLEAMPHRLPRFMRIPGNNFNKAELLSPTHYSFEREDRRSIQRGFRHQVAKHYRQCQLFCVIGFVIHDSTQLEINGRIGHASLPLATDRGAAFRTDLAGIFFDEVLKRGRLEAHGSADARYFDIPECNLFIQTTDGNRQPGGGFVAVIKQGH
jgi:hypothetical protein